MPRAGPPLLDVGCATGDLLMAARHLGFEAEGLEPSDWSAGIRAWGFEVHQGTRKPRAALAGSL
jgi:hypothetical protein